MKSIIQSIVTNRNPILFGAILGMTFSLLTHSCADRGDREAATLAGPPTVEQARQWIADEQGEQQGKPIGIRLPISHVAIGSCAESGLGSQTCDTKFTIDERAFVRPLKYRNRSNVELAVAGAVDESTNLPLEADFRFSHCNDDAIVWVCDFRYTLDGTPVNERIALWHKWNDIFIYARPFKQNSEIQISAVNQWRVDDMQDIRLSVADPETLKQLGLPLTTSDPAKH